MKNINEIKITTESGTTYYSTIIKGIDYLIYKIKDEWTVGSSKTSLGGLRRNPGTWKYFNTLEEIGRSIKNLRNIELMIE